MKLCVYGIVRDEEANIAEWAETTGDADARFVLDTGSTDNTRRELLFHGIGNLDAALDPFRFDDARNMALALAPAADLYLRLDADERLPDGWRAMIEDAYHPDVPRYRYRVHNNGGIWNQITRDDLHQRPGFRWKYPTHEVLTGPAAARDLPQLIIEHTSPPERRSHHLSNLSVLAEATTEYPGDHRMAFYFARELWYAGRWDDCRVAMTTFLDMPRGWGAERAEAYRILAAIDYSPERWLWKAIGEAPERREPWVDLCRLFLKAGDAERAVGMFMEAERRTDQTAYTTDPGAWGGAFDDLRDTISKALDTVAQ
jgi:hypothetical protein